MGLEEGFNMRLEDVFGFAVVKVAEAVDV